MATWNQCSLWQKKKKKKSPKQGFPCDSDKAYLPSAVNCCIAQHKWVLPVTSEVSAEIATKWFSGPTFILSDTSLELPALPFPASFLVSTVSWGRYLWYGMGYGVMTLNCKHLHQLVVISMSEQGLIKIIQFKGLWRMKKQSRQRWIIWICRYSRLYPSGVTYPLQQRCTEWSCPCPCWFWKGQLIKAEGAGCQPSPAELLHGCTVIAV